LAKLRADFEAFKKDTSNNFISCQELIGRKVGKEELLELENRIMEKLNEML
jgi:hypothetical protein